jgi:glycosyltransferase involved in cell wall biosynthesis
VEHYLDGWNVSVRPLTVPAGKGLRRKLAMPGWFLRNLRIFFSALRKADAVHAPIPGDVGTIGMILALIMRKPLFVRHCGNWNVQRTTAERFWKWFMERFAGGRNLMLATGGADQLPSRINPDVRWIFSSSLTEEELLNCASEREAPSGGRLRLITASRQEPRKGTDVVIRSIPTILSDFPDATLDVVGDGAALEDYRKLAHQLGVSERVTFHGYVNHERVIELLRKSDIFCYPTTASEGFPKVVLEALACGLPVVTTRVSVLPSLLSGGCGLLLDDTSSESIARALRAVATEGYSRMSAQAIATAKKYSLEQWSRTIGEALASQWGDLKVVPRRPVKSNA